uniref:Odorant-binding protein 23 n=1 Tax=Dastarcus helophoroides TaxID=1169899 RepID=A0A1I9HZQ5_9CUCU|nr:odorant-binding protein 23 [Dastarcus helophoroides]
MKLLLLLVGCFSLLISTNAVMTDKQMKAALKLLGNTCLSKSKADPAQVQALRKGEWPEEKPIMSYLYCVLNTQNIITKESGACAN